MQKLIVPIFGAAAAASLVSNAAAEPASEAPVAVLPDSPSLEWGGCPPVFPGACEIAVLHGNPAEPNADVLLKVGPGYELPRHRHTSAERMVLLSGELWVSYDGAEAVTLTPSTYAFGPPGLPHEAKCVSETPCTLFIAFEGPVDAEAVAGL